MSRVPRVVVWLVAVVLLAATPSAENRGPRVTGIYSNMRYIDEAGDVLGTEVFIVYSSKGYFAIVQVAEGVPSVPAVVPIKVEGSRVSLSLPLDMGGGQFRGQVTEGGLSGRFADDREPWELKRGKSYWQ
jgi:hypothetical protein